MTRMICLDGAMVSLDADRVVVDLAARGLKPADHADALSACTCCEGEAWLPVMSYEDGTTVYLHAGATPGYRVTGPRAHRWVVQVVVEAGERVAHLGWETHERVEIRRVPLTSWRRVAS